jgi:hypothetical protein
VTACGSSISEEVLVDPLHHVGRLVLNADVVPDHEVRKGVAVDQDQSCVHAVCVVDGVRGEAAGSDEDASVGLRSVQRADERLNIRPADSTVSGMALGLDVDAIQP